MATQKKTTNFYKIVCKFFISNKKIRYCLINICLISDNCIVFVEKNGIKAPSQA